MRNKQLQSKLREMLDELVMLDDDLVVARYTGLGLTEVMMFGMELLDVDGKVTTDGGEFPVDCIVLNV